MKKKILLTLVLTNIFVCFLLPIKALNQNDLEIEKMITNMSQKEKIGQMMMLDFRQWTINDKFENLTEMNSDLAKIISDYSIGGIVLFRENIVDLLQTVRLTDKMQKAVKNNISLMIAIDQEGGQVTRLKFGTSMPGNMALGAVGSESLSKDVAKAIGSEIYSVGINVDFAPAADINSNYKNPVIGIRSFSSDVTIVNNMTKAYIEGLHEANVISVTKHFPGHGDTEQDSHFDLPIIDKSLDYLMTHDLLPFKVAIKADVDMIMSAHIVVPALDDTKITLTNKKTIATPATLSKKILEDLVRNDFEYKGVIITDSLQMKAITDNFSEAETVVQTFIAGSDIALMPTLIRSLDDTVKLDAIYNAILKAIANGSLSEKRIDESVYRILALKKKYGLLNTNDNQTVDEKIKSAKAIVSSQHNLRIEKKMADRAVTLIKNDGETLPFNLKDNQSVLFVTAFSPRATLMQARLNQIAVDKNLVNVKSEYFVYQNNDDFTNFDKQAVDRSSYVVLETTNLSDNSKYLYDLVNYANAKSKKLVLMSTSNPYDIMYLPNVLANIAVYGFSGYDQTQAGTSSLPINIVSGIDAIFNQINPQGKLPVTIYDKNDSNLYKLGHGLSYEQPVKTDSLKEIIKKANDLNKDIYSAKSYAEMLNSVTKAQQLLKKEQSSEIVLSQIEVDAALENIVEAMVKLEIVKTPNDKYFSLVKNPVLLTITSLFLTFLIGLILVLKKRKKRR